jgi:hypothetical protein
MGSFRTTPADGQGSGGTATPHEMRLPRRGRIPVVQEPLGAGPRECER